MKSLLFLALISANVFASGFFGGGGSSSTPLSGTSGRLTRWSAADAIGPSLWSEGSTGLVGYQGAQLGTVSATLLNLDATRNTGFFIETTFRRPAIAVNGVHAVEWGSTPDMYLLDGSGNKLRIWNSGGLNITQPADGFNGAINFNAPAAAAYSQLNLKGASGTQLMIEGFVDDGTVQVTDPGNIFMSGTGTNGGGGSAVADKVDFLQVGRGGGVSIGPWWKRANALSVNSRADWTGPSGTTTANASQTITGSSTFFTNDFGTGDWVALSSAPTVFAEIDVITSDTSMHTKTAIGNGTSQTFVRRQAQFSSAERGHLKQVMIEPDGKMKFDGATNGTVGTTTCNGATEVTVNNTQVKANSIILMTIQVPGGTVSTPYVSSRVAGTSFGMKCTAGDTSTVGYWITEPIL